MEFPLNIFIQPENLMKLFSENIIISKYNESLEKLLLEIPYVWIKIKFNEFFLVI